MRIAAAHTGPIRRLHTRGLTRFSQAKLCRACGGKAAEGGKNPPVPKILVVYRNNADPASVEG